MANMRLDKNPMPAQDPNVRNKNFDEVALGYTEEMAIDEAKRCLNCKNPKCVSGCPVNVRIPEFITRVAEGDFDGAYEIITSTNSLPAICGRVCPQENQCEGQCIRGIKGESVGIGRLERFVADYHNAHGHQGGAPAKPEPNGHKVAIVGSGPAGLTCAGDLARKGYDVTVYEALHLAGGVLVYGIPEFRLPKAIVQKEVKRLEYFGVKVVTNTVVGRTITIDELMEEEGYEAVFVGSGAGLPMFMNIPGENLKGVFSANEFLTRINLMKAYRPDSDTPIQHPKKVAVVGGGNVAMDAARCSKRLGAEVYVVYRRGMEELPARHEEVEHAEEEGYEAVFVGSGAGLPMFMNIPGENLKGVFSANEFLTRINLMKAYREDSDTPIMDLKGKKVAVVGGGNVAMDAARCSKRLGAEVWVVYRRGMEELPARHEEVEHAIEEGIIFKTLNNPIKINGDENGAVASMTCIEMELGEPDASGRRRPIEKVGSEFELPVDAVIMSLGTNPNPLIKSTTKGLEVNKKGGIIVNEDGLTSRAGVYAGGDAVTGAATVILAMGAGKLAAKSIDEALSK